VTYTPRKLSLQGQKITGRVHLHRTFAEAYRHTRRTELIFGSIMLLLMSLVALLPIVALLYAKYGGNQ